MEEKTYKEIRPEYVGPYVRNPVEDFVNDYEVRRFQDKVFSLLSYFIILFLFAGEIGFYYAMRLSIVDYAQSNP